MSIWGLPDIEFLAPERLWAIPGALVIFLVVTAFAFRNLAELKRSLFAREFVRKEDMLPIRMKALSFVAMVVAAILLALATAMPVAVMEVSTPRYGGVRLTYIVDVSISMDALDGSAGPPVKSRFTLTRESLFALEDALLNDPALRGVYPRTVIPFAGAATTYGPWTTSEVYMHELLRALSTEGMIGKQGSDLAFALETYRNQMAEYPKEALTTDIGIVISDGGNDPGGFVIDVEKLAATLAALRREATIVAVGIGGDQPATIPNRRVVEDEVSYGDMMESVKVPNPRNIERLDGVLKKPSGEPWLSAFDEAMMLTLSGVPERCVRFRETPSGDPRQCRGAASVPEMVNALREIILANRTTLPPEVVLRRTPVALYFGLLAALFLTLGLLAERIYGAWRRRASEPPMREVLFRRSSD